MKKRHRASPWLLLIYAVFLIYVVLISFPIMQLVSKSVSGETAILSGQVGIVPDFGDIHWDSYRMVFGNHLFIQAFWNTVAYTLLGTFVALISTSGFAYALSKPYLTGRKFFHVLSIFVMIFSGGLIPTYLVMSTLGLVNTFHILWMAGAFGITNMLILKTSFESMPVELEEAAVMDGANQLTILFRVYLPLSKAVLAVIALYYAVDYWNNYFTSMLYTTKQSLKSLQLVLKEIIYSSSDVFLALHGNSNVGEVTSQSVIAACVVVATIPICMVYPFLQKYFAKGVMIGSVKG